jgi:hypothetical protein
VKILGLKLVAGAFYIANITDHAFCKVTTVHTARSLQVQLFETFGSGSIYNEHGALHLLHHQFARQERRIYQ